MLKFLITMFTAVVFLAGCTGGEEAKEPVAADDKPPTIPDIPGDSGESAEKPAGTGQAGEVAEKSQPNVEAARASQPTAGEPGTVNSGALNVRSGPGMKYEVVRVLQKGEKVTLSDCGAVWCKIADGQYVSRRFINN